MSSVGLLFVGAALLLNGLLLLGRLDSRSVAVFNVFVGALQVTVPFYLMATAKTPDDVLGAAGIFLFGFTYLYVGIVNLAGISGDGIGWYSLWVAVLAVCFAVTNIVRFHDLPTGLLWFQWAVLFALFWLVLGLGLDRLAPVTGWLTLILSVTTCTVPGFLLLLGKWSAVPGWALVVTIIATAAVLLPVGLRGGTRAGPPAPVTAA